LDVTSISLLVRNWLDIYSDIYSRKYKNARGKAYYARCTPVVNNPYFIAARDEAVASYDLHHDVAELVRNRGATAA